MNTREAAERLGISPKVLRRHLRMSDDWKSAGVGGQYSFTEDDLTTLRRQLGITSDDDLLDGYDWMDVDQGIPVEVMEAAKANPRLHALIIRRRRARLRKLGDQAYRVGVIDRMTLERSYHHAI